MNISRLLNRSISATILLNVVLVVLWLLSAFLLETDKKSAEITVFDSIPLFSLNYFWSVILQLLCFVLIVFFVFRNIVLQHFSVTAYMPFSLMMLLGTITPAVHIFGNQTVATFFLLLATLQLIKNYKAKNSSVIAINTFLLLTLSIFFVPEFVCFIPIFIFGFIYLVEAEIKSMAAILFSIAMPILTVLGICFLFDDMPFFQVFFAKLFNIQFAFNTKIITIENVFVVSILIFFTLISLFFYFRNNSIYKLQIRQFINFSILLWLTTLLFIIFTKNYFVFFLFLLILTSLFMALNFNYLRPKKMKIKRKKNKVSRRIRKV